MEAVSQLAGKRVGGGTSATRVIVAIAVILLLAAPFGYRARYRGRILPGVTVAGVHVGGLTADRALARLTEAGLDPYLPVAVRFADEDHLLAAGESGIALDSRATVARAYGIGRTGFAPLAFAAAIRARAFGVDVEPRVVFDPESAANAMSQLASRLNRPPRDAALRIDGTAAQGTSAQPGMRLDEAAAARALESAAALGEWPLPTVSLPTQVVPATIMDSGGAVARAVDLLADDVKLRSADRMWTMQPVELAPLITTTVREGMVVLDIDRPRLEAWLAPVSEEISRTARNPRFRFDPESRQLSLLEIGHSGRRIDVDATAERILSASDDPRRLVQIAISITPPQVADNASARELGIREVVHEETSRYAGSPPERIHNIGVAASRFDGLLIPPDAVFSFNDNIGEISPETGYEKTLIIMDGATRDGVGGGVCQVSTTLFRAAFWAGLPIVERFAHGYRVAYYEQGAPPGLDATVFQPRPDVRFRNDTGSWLLIETESDPKQTTVTFRLLGMKPDREVAMEGPQVTAIVPPPPPRVEVDPELAPGSSEQIELARSGASVSVTRVITVRGEQTREVFYSKYRPTGAVTAVGPPSAVPTAGAPPTALP